MNRCIKLIGLFFALKGRFRCYLNFILYQSVLDELNFKLYFILIESK